MKLVSLAITLATAACVDAAGPLLVRKADICAKPQPNTCNFYTECLEARYNCGPAGYPLAFGSAYCTKFTGARAGFSPAGQAWVTRTMLCLQEALVPFVAANPASGPTSTATCDRLRETAQAAHSPCYVQSGLCALPPGDWLQISRTLGGELFNLANIREAIQTLGECLTLKRWLGIP